MRLVMRWSKVFVICRKTEEAQGLLFSGPEDERPTSAGDGTLWTFGGDFRCKIRPHRQLHSIWVDG